MAQERSGGIHRPSEPGPVPAQASPQQHSMQYTITINQGPLKVHRTLAEGRGPGPGAGISETHSWQPRRHEPANKAAKLNNTSVAARRKHCFSCHITDQPGMTPMYNIISIEPSDLNSGGVRLN